MSQTEIVFNIACSVLKRVHAAFEEKNANEMTSYPDSRRFRVNVERVDLVVNQYQTVRFRSPDDDAWRIPVSDSNACSVVR